MLRAIYGVLQSASLFYEKFRADLEHCGFKVNACGPCVFNKIVNRHQMAACIHVDDCKSSHVGPKAKDEFAKWANEKHGKHKKITVTRGKKHIESRSSKMMSSHFV